METMPKIKRDIAIASTRLVLISLGLIFRFFLGVFTIT